MTSASMYEHLSALTSVMKQRVVENFSGTTLDTFRWNTATGTFAMTDSADEGFSISSSGGDNAVLSFNNKRQYSPTASVLIGVFRRVTASGHVGFGFGYDAPDMWGNALNQSTVHESTAFTYKRLRTGDNSSYSYSDSTVAVDTAWHNYKIVNSASDTKLYIDGVLEATSTTNRTASAQQPSMMAAGGATQEGRIRYLEAYNT